MAACPSRCAVLCLKTPHSGGSKAGNTYTTGCVLSCTLACESLLIRERVAEASAPHRRSLASHQSTSHKASIQGCAVIPFRAAFQT